MRLSNDRYCRSSRGTSRENNRKNDSFFSAPHLNVLEGLQGINITLSVCGRNDVDEPTPDENYEIVVWKLRVKNKLERVGHFGDDCSAKIYWNFIKMEGNLSWKVAEESTKISVGTNPVSLPYIHNKFREFVGTEYALELQMIGETK